MRKVREDEAEKARDEWLNEIKPTVPVRKEWRAKPVKAPAVPAHSDDEDDMLDDEGSPVIKDGSPPHDAMDMNMVFILPSEFQAVEESETAQLYLGPQEAVFQKPDESSKHLKPLYLKGHINGRPIPRMMVDGGAAVNFMPYSLFKKLGREDSELIKTNLTLNGFGGEPTEAMGVISMELTIGSKTIPTAFFVADKQDDDVEIVHADTSAFIAMADASANWQHGNAQCVSGLDLTECDFLSVTKDGFVPVVVKPAAAARLSNLML
ncbi:hypothetical protein U9M48_029792 [Paspalum notatum var. saurae]|uniref:Retrotransposon protein, putative, unclassified n=1 Tax=Paspalum notatum var. saurae TaxID=547442 RepID=A0AAQ3TZK8_PASNO